MDEITSMWREAYLGSARVSLNRLRPSPYRADRTVDRKRVSALCKVFKLEGCRNYDEETRIRVVIDRQTWASYETGAGASASLSLLQIPDDCTLTYEHGLHRVAAALHFLPVNKQEWGVDVYDARGPSICFNPPS